MKMPISVSILVLTLAFSAAARADDNERDGVRITGNALAVSSTTTAKGQQTQGAFTAGIGFKTTTDFFTWGQNSSFEGHVEAGLSADNHFVGNTELTVIATAKPDSDGRGGDYSDGYVVPDPKTGGMRPSFMGRIVSGEMTPTYGRLAGFSPGIDLAKGQVDARFWADWAAINCDMTNPVAIQGCQYNPSVGASLSYSDGQWIDAKVTAGFGGLVNLDSQAVGVGVSKNASARFLIGNQNFALGPWATVDSERYSQKADSFDTPTQAQFTTAHANVSNQEIMGGVMARGAF